MLEQTTMETGPELNLPWELSQWAKPAELRAWLDEIIGGLDWGNPELRQWERANPDVQPRVMLSVLTLAYALGRYDAEEIENACFKEPIFIEVCENRWQPRATQLNHFRKQNRGLLKYCLFELFKRAFKVRFEMGDAFIPAGIRKHLLESSVARLDLARQMSRGLESL